MARTSRQASVDSQKPIARGTRDVSDAAADAHADSEDDIASLAHDLRTPLAIVSLEAGVLAQRLGPRAGEPVLRGLERIAQNAAYMDRLIGNLLDLASSNAGALELSLAWVDLARLVRDTLARGVPSLERARVRLELRAAPRVRADATRIERVVSNLVANALKYAPAGSPVVIRLDARGPRACVSVIDTGPGLTSEEARRAFERYRHGRRGGYGLGLYICRRIVEAHGGRIGVTTSPGLGARFFFELPVDEG